MREVTMLAAVLMEDGELVTCAGRVAVSRQHTRRDVLNLFRARVEAEIGKKISTITVVSENDPEVIKALEAQKSPILPWMG